MDTGYKDPREAAGFIAELYPTANRHPAPPPNCPLRNDAILLEFLAAYYRLNCEYAQLLKVRQSPPSPERDQSEREQLQAVEQALIARDQVEDLYAPYGVIAEPSIRDGFTRDVRISFGEPARGKRPQDGGLLIEAILPIGLTADFDLDQLPVRVQAARGHDPRRFETDDPCLPGSLEEPDQSTEKDSASGG
jgi:hypothetical protein